MKKSIFIHPPLPYYLINSNKHLNCNYYKAHLTLKMHYRQDSKANKDNDKQQLVDKAIHFAL